MLRRLVLLLLVAMGAGACDGETPVTPTPAPPNSTTVTIRVGASNLGSNAYVPSPMSVTVGTLVSFVNNDTTTHTTVADAGAWTSPNIAPGNRFNVTLTTAGVYAYHCSLHAGMVGTITVQ